MERPDSRTVEPGFQLVRAFSDEFRQDSQSNILGRGLSTAIITADQKQENLAHLRDQWNVFLLEGRKLAIDLIPSEEAILLAQSRDLHQAWAKFCKALPKEQGGDLSTQMPSLKVLHSAVATASQTWQERREGTKVGRLKGIFTRLSETFESHSNIVSIIPTNDKYVTLLTGSLTAIAAACTNHKNLADGVSASLEELGDGMLYWNMLIDRHAGDPMIRRHLVCLYTIVFEFLTEIFTQWSKSSWKRLVTSFDQQSVSNLFDDKRNRIKVIERRIERYIELAQSRQDDDFQKRTEQWQLQMQMDMQSQLQRLGEDIKATLLDAHRSRALSVEPIPTLPAIGPPDMNIRTSARQGVALLSGSPQSAQADFSNAFIDSNITERERITVSEALKLLEPMIRKHKDAVDRLIAITSRTANLKINNLVGRRLQTWLAGRDSTPLWIQGPHGVSHPSQNTLTAASLVAVARKNGASFVYYFASVQCRSPEAGCRTVQQLLLDLIKSLIVQLLLLARQSDGADTTLYLEVAKIEQLPTRGPDFDHVLAVLRGLRPLVPRRLYCFVEAVQELEDRGDKLHTRNLRALFKELANLGQPVTADPGSASDGEMTGRGDDELGKTVKICLLSDGHVDVLAASAQGGFIEKISYTSEVDDLGEDDGGQVGVSWDAED
ncbi:hypothetical protein MN608_10979 [Microdochium nivale]|nr:hypothetical protein MN608_10979 [Microdochium nivale]